MAGILDAWSRHAQTTQAMKGNTGMGVIPNYGYSSGADFQANFPNLDPRVTAVLASGYQLGQEGLRALNPFGNTFLDFKGAYKTAAEQAAENIRGALELNQKVISPEQLALNQKYANSVLQGKSVYNTPELASNKGILNSIENFFFTPASADAIPTEAERQAVEKNIQGYDYTFDPNVLAEEENAQYNLPNRGIDLTGIMQNIGSFAKDYAKDLGGRYITSQALGGAGAMLGGPVVGGIAALAGLLKGGDLFNSPYMGADAYTMDQYGNMYTAGQLNKMNARGGYYSEPARQSRLRDQSIKRMEERKAQGLSYGLNRLAELKQQKAQEEAARRSTSGTYLTGGGGDTFNFSDNSGYGGTGTASPSNVGPGGTLGGGV